MLFKYHRQYYWVHKKLTDNCLQEYFSAARRNSTLQLQKSFSMDSTITRILEETYINNVNDIVFNPSKKKWVISYHIDLYTNEFDFFDEVYEFLTTKK